MAAHRLERSIFQKLELSEGTMAGFSPRTNLSTSPVDNLVEAVEALGAASGQVKVIGSLTADNGLINFLESLSDYTVDVSSIYRAFWIYCPPDTKGCLVIRPVTF